jgi:transposase
MRGVMNSEEVCNFMTIDSGTTLKVFFAFIEQQLIKYLKDGNCVIMDHISVHKNERIIQQIEMAGAVVKFLPPYSPDLNPIEKLWSKLKTKFKAYGKVIKRYI